MIKKFIMLAGFSMAIVSFIFQYTKNIYILGAVFAAVYLLLWVLLEIENRIRNSEGNFFNKFFYYFGRTTEDYIIEYAESCYEYIGMQEMQYSLDLELKSCVNNLRTYEDKFCWSAYGSSISVTPRHDKQTINMLAPRNLWNAFEIDLGQRYKKRDIIKTGFNVINLKDELGVAKPFLSHKSDSKIKERIMTVKIPEELNPVNARFEICKTSETGKAIKSELLTYNNKIKGFSKHILYPRKGWTYTISWEWKDK